jgi:NAD(P)-dependent dehydrogenase (short-subunit alcohol dehydrogenase family)
MNVALITGAARRLGRATALRLAAEGWTVAAHYGSSRDDADSLKAEISAIGGHCALFQADLADPGAARALVGQVAATLGQPVVLVNNASTFFRDDADDFTAEGLARNMAVNLTAPLLLAQAFHAGAAEGADNVIINMLDNKLWALNPDFFTYTLAKSALMAATEMLALKFAPRVRTCGIAPGLTMISGRQTQESFDRAWRLNPMRRGPLPEDIAEAAAFILRQPSMNGRVIVLDGGQSLAKPPRDVAFL